MSAQTPDSFFQEQGNSPEVAERSEIDVSYLSPDSVAEEAEPTIGTGAPGFASVTSFVESTYAQTVISTEEDRKLPPSPATSSKQSSDSELEYESEVEKPKKKTIKLKMSESTLEERKNGRVKRNAEFGLNKVSKKAKKQTLWEYTEQKLVPDLVVQILPIPKEPFVFRKIMTMVKAEDISVPHSDTTLLKVLDKFRNPTTPTVKLRDVQTERAGFLMFRRVVVRKRIAAGKYSFAIMPNMVITNQSKVYHRTPDGVWYEKTTTNKRSKEMAIPKPFEGNQSVDVLFENTFSWEEV